VIPPFSPDWKGLLADLGGALLVAAALFAAGFLVGRFLQ
jgi:hypothetical protein